MPDRRSLLFGGPLLPTPSLRTALGAEPAVQSFMVERNGAPIGRHTLAFLHERGRLRVTIEIDLEVRLAFITLYRYWHHNEETWLAGRFHGFTSRSNDNGTEHLVRVRRTEEVIEVETQNAMFKLPGDTLPTTYWHRSFLDAQHWIDTQSGQLLSCRIEPRGTMRLLTTGGSILADRFAVTGDLSMDLWYAGEVWSGLEFTASDGSQITYRLEHSAPPAGVRFK